MCLKQCTSFLQMNQQQNMSGTATTTAEVTMAPTFVTCVQSSVTSVPPGYGFRPFDV